MPYARSSHLPSEVGIALKEIGQAIRIARLRRRQSAADVAARVGVSLPTFRKLEHGDPTVSLGAFATAAWLLGLLPGVQDAVRPKRCPGCGDGSGAGARRGRRPREVSSMTSDPKGRTTVQDVFVHVRHPDGQRHRRALQVRPTPGGTAIRRIRVCRLVAEEQPWRAFPLDPANLPLQPGR